ncbi:amino-acid transporter arg-13 [Cryomyces antarcticus]|uniref:Mitochondrial ornithine carrier protein n=1 Tax=Cryomyces antarcticus TaxID=329879 RepID=A0ABR0M7L0_9PEZI|nr:mitochondrial ornithine carrier protein [Cryomyces antarcticus]KAK5018453.1 mitochondrial ornithine carrier protein [Cryomyces antarcticus]KAK5168512.1 hypothetical protein LTR04_006590 [Oleoguttula sp. CCFEE 6159]KAK5291152.1 mitochondrial ornithine carrier protein [Cryomyces antarcticus]
MDFKEAQVPMTSAPLENATARPSFTQGQEALKDVVFGSAAGIVGKFIEYPFDTVKVRLQSQAEHLPLQYSGPLDCFKQSLRKDGISSLYRGISAPLFGAAVETSSLFFSYRVAQDILTSTVLTPSTPLPMTALVACGAVSGAFTSMLLTPIELIKCKMQVPVASSSSVTRHSGPLNLIVSVYRHHGFFGFWHGQLGTLIRETGGSAAWFGSYEGVSLAFKKTRGATTTSGSNEVKDDSLPVYQQMVAGAVAGMSYNFIFYPADTIKSRMQTEEIGAVNGGKRTFWSVGAALWRQQGMKGMYRGCGITVGRAAPSSAFIFTVYEYLRKTFG